MDNENNRIDDLFTDKFDNFEFKTSPEEWSNLSTSLSKVNFFKFSFTSVNAYVVGAGVALASSGGYIGVKHIINSDKTEDSNNKIELVEPPQKVENKSSLIDSSTYVFPTKTEIEEVIREENISTPERKEQAKQEKIKTLDSSTYIKPTKPKIEKQQKDKSINNNTVVKQTKVKDENRVLIRDSVEIQPDTAKAEQIIEVNSKVKTQPDTTRIPQKRKIRRVKKKIFIKKDKVIVKDTIVIKK